MESYNLRARKNIDYKAIEDLKLPRQEKTRREDKLYSITVLERDLDCDRVKIHYSGYSDKHDEWRDAADIVDPPVVKKETYRPFELHRELALQIKLALTSANNRDPAVRIELPFDKLLFSGGLKQLGYYCHTTRGHEIYGIHSFSCLVPLLGTNWHFRGLNEQLDVCYINKVTVQYYLHKRKALTEFTPSGREEVDSGYILVFKFVRMDGVASEWDSVCSQN